MKAPLTKILNMPLYSCVVIVMWKLHCILWSLVSAAGAVESIGPVHSLKGRGVNWLHFVIQV